MFSKSILDEFTRTLGALMPGGANSTLQQEFGRSVTSALQGTLQRLDLVTREEYEVQCEVLARTRQRLEELEKQLDSLENAQPQ